MHFVRAAVLVLALIEAGWMSFDGTRALTVGDYVTAKTGPRAGELGPWQHVVRAIGIAPRSILMKVIFVVYGVMWLLILVAFLRRAPWAGDAMMIAALGALWYLPIGTVCSVFQIAGLLWLRRTA